MTIFRHLWVKAAFVWALILTGSFTIGAAPVLSQQIPITIEFQGEVSRDPAGTLSIGPGGNYTGGPEYVGNLPDYPYAVGDPVTATISTFLPSPEAFAAGTTGITPQPDGTYKIALVGENNAGGAFDPGKAVISDFDVSGPIAGVLNNGQPLDSFGFFVTFDPATEGYTLGMFDNQFRAATFDAPGYEFNVDTGMLELVGSTCLGGTTTSCINGGDGGFQLFGDAGSISTTPIRIWDSLGDIFGSFSLGFAGNWSVSGGGGATQVPEPSMLLIFGAGATAVMRRRRRHPAAGEGAKSLSLLR